MILSLPSMLVFGPHTSTLSSDDLYNLRRSLLLDARLQPLRVAFESLPDLWPVLVESDPRLACVPGKICLEQLVRLISHGDTPSPISENTIPNIIVTPMTVLLHLTQYLAYVGTESEGPAHAVLLERLRGHGGILGFCTGLLCAAAIASSQDEQIVLKYAETVLKLAVCIGAYIDADGIFHSPPNENSCFVARWSSEEKKKSLEEVIETTPGAYISVLTDSNTVTITAPTLSIVNIMQDLDAHSISTKLIDTHGRFHTSYHESAAASLRKFCSSTPDLQLPTASELFVSVSANDASKTPAGAFLHDVIIDSILVNTCNWQHTISEALLHSNENSTILQFGLLDCVPSSVLRTSGAEIIRATSLRFWNNATTSHLRGNPHSSNSRSDSDIAIIGMAGRFPGADDVSQLWDLLRNGSSQCKPMPEERFNRFNLRRSPDNKLQFYGNFVNDVDAFDHRFFNKSSREAGSMDPQQRLLLEVAYQALESSGHFGKFGDRAATNDIGCYVGVCASDYNDNVASHPPNAYSSLGTLRAFLTGKLSHFFGWTGPSITYDTACSSSAVAIHAACKAVQTGECSMAVAGGVSIYTSPNFYQNLAAASFLSPTGPTKPFDASGDGYCRGEGAGLVVLKRLSDAITDGDDILGVIAATAVNQNENSTSITVPHSESQMKLYQKVVHDAGIKPHDVTVVEAHGTGTPVGDPLEFASIRKVFGGASRKDILHVSSIKGNIGHLEGASGVASLIKTILMMRHRKIPVHANHWKLNPKIAPLDADRLAIPLSTKDWEADSKIACINNYGAAGSNAAMIVRGPPSISKSKVSANTRLAKYPLFISANTATSLQAYCRSILKIVDELSSQYAEEEILEAIAFRLANQQNHLLPQFIAGSASSVKELEGFLMNPPSPSQRPKTSKKVVLVFGGQTTRSVGLSRELLNSSFLLRKHLNACEQSVKSLGLQSIYPAIFSTEPITDVVLLHTIFFAIQYASAKAWIDSGLKPAALIGHSFGQLTALAVSGALSLQDGLRLVTGRASLMQKHWGSERGAMISVQAEIEVVSDIIQAVDPTIEIACYNGPNSHVLVGTKTAIEKVQSLLRNDKDKFANIKCKVLDVDYGFHSRFTEPLLADFGKLTEQLQLGSPEIPLETCSEGQPWTTMTAANIAQHTRTPVYFTEAVERISNRLGPCTWIEAGSNSSVTGMVRNVLKNNREHVFQGSNFNGTSALSALAEITVKLWSLDIAVQFWPFDPRQQSKYLNVSLPPYQFEKSRHWLEWKDNVTQETPILPVESAKPTEAVLLSLVKYLTSDKDEAEFYINPASKEYRFFVEGHAVLAEPLCPAPLYIDLVSKAAKILNGEETTTLPTVDDLEIQSPLGIRSRNISLVLKRNTRQATSWTFSISSSAEGGGATDIQCHATGIVSLLQDTDRIDNDFARYENLVSASKFEQLREEIESEVLQGALVYKVFGKVVTYRPYYKGVRSVHSLGRQILGRVSLPPLGDADIKEKDVAGTLALDNFIQVSGLHVNCLSEVPDNQVWVCTKVDHYQVRKDMTGMSSWMVYSTYRFTGDRELVNDIFVLDTNTKELIAFILGARFTRVQITSLARVLSRANQDSAAAPTRSTVRIDAESVPTPVIDLERSMSGPKKLRKKMTPQPPIDVLNKLRTVLQTVAEVPGDEVRESATFDDLGIDSLMITEVLSEINAAFSLEISMDELATMDDIAAIVAGVQKRLGIYSLLSDSDSDDSQFDTHHGTPTLSSGATTPPDESQMAEAGIPDMVSKLASLLADHLETSDSITMETNLADQGLDSLLSIELATDIKKIFGADIDMAQLDGDSTFADLVKLVFPAGTLVSIHPDRASQSKTMSIPVSAPSVDSTLTDVPLIGAQAAFESVRFNYDDFTKKTGFNEFWAKVYPTQARLVRAYVVEAFTQLGCDLNSLESGAALPDITYLPRHEKLVQQLYNILRDGQLVAMEGSHFIRTDQSVDTTSSTNILEQLISKAPQHAAEHKLLHLTGSKLAACLTGETDALDILFRSKANKELLEEVYAKGPMYEAISGLLCSFLERAFSTTANPSKPFQILELGGGTGGTTRYVVKLLDSLGIPYKYTFTDLSGSLVAAAKKKFAGNKSMEFKTIDIEKQPSSELEGKYHAIISTNCIHATRNLELSTRHMNHMLRPDGFISLVEFTRNIFWFDLVFGLLDGWWLFEDNRPHVLASEWFWDASMRQAGFQHVTWTDGPSLEARTLRIISGFKAAPETSNFVPPCSPSDADTKVETLLYKRIDGIPLFADIHYPPTISQQPSPIALMIHGGGHIMLSRRDIRPKQTSHLQSLGFVPISIDYRLCPETTLREGPMEDVCDAIGWVQSTLNSPQLLCQSLNLDSTRIAVVGWSTGGHLAMTTAFTTIQRGLPPPTAILSFYCPTNYEDSFWTRPNFPENSRAVAQDSYDLLEGVREHPITAYNVSNSTRAVGGWMAPTDPRSRIVLHMNWKGQFMPVLLRGLPAKSKVNADDAAKLLDQPQPSIEDVQSVSPYAQIKKGAYRTPTFVVHGTEDDLIPWQQSLETVEALKEKGVHAGVEIVDGKVHLFDLYADKDGKGWEAIRKAYEFIAREIFN